MQKLSEVRFAKEAEYDTLKKLWKTSFDDSEKALDAFFEKTVSEQNVLAVFCEECAVGALYMLESEIAVCDVTYPAYYIYAVCTHPNFRGNGIMHMLFGKLQSVAKEREVPYLFLIPENENLFAAYRKMGFRNAIVYKAETFSHGEYMQDGLKKLRPLDYNRYTDFCLLKAQSHTVAFLKEGAFNSFFYSVDGSVGTFDIGSGYAVYEITKDGVTVFEFYGDKAEIVNTVFAETGAETVVLRSFCTADDSAVQLYGMCATTSDDVPVIENAFFGIPYST